MCYETVSVKLGMAILRFRLNSLVPFSIIVTFTQVD